MKKKIIVPLMAIALICVSVINYNTIQSANESGVTLRSLVKISSAESEENDHCFNCGILISYVSPGCTCDGLCQTCCLCNTEVCPLCSEKECVCPGPDYCSWCDSEPCNCNGDAMCEHGYETGCIICDN